MRKDKQKKFQLLFFSIIIVSMLSVGLFNLVPSARADVPSRFGTIDYTWIAVSVDPFEDIHTNDGQGRFYVSEGGYQLVKFTNEGYAGVNTTSNTLFYRASAVFRFGINAFTLASVTDAFPNIEMSARETKEYVEILKYSGINIFCGTPSDPYCKFNDLEIISAGVNYRTIDFDTTVANVPDEPFNGVNIKLHDYDGHIPITVQLHEDFGAIAEMEIAEGLTLYNPTMIAEVKKVIVDVTRQDTVGDYEDVYVNEQSDFGQVSVYYPEDSDASLGTGAERADLMLTIENLDLGSRLGEKNEGINMLGGKEGRYMVRAEPPGRFFDNLDSTPSFKFDLPMRIKPEISYCSQDVNVRWAQLEWDYHDLPFISPADVWVTGDPRTDVYQRYPSVHVTNRYVHQEFIVEVNFIASMQFDPVLGGVILEDPFVMAGDFVWDESLRGTSDYTIVPHTSDQDFFNSLVTTVLPLIFFIVIVCVVIYIMKLVMPLLIFRMGQKSK